MRARRGVSSVSATSISGLEGPLLWYAWLYIKEAGNGKASAGRRVVKYQALATDYDGTSDIVYQLQWDDDSVLDSSPLGDRVSSDETGCHHHRLLGRHALIALAKSVAGHDDDVHLMNARG